MPDIGSFAASFADLWYDTSFYLMVGFLLAGLLKAFVKTETVARYLGSPTLGSVVKASLIGLPLPLCSCSVIPVAHSLKKNGATNGATVSFLISTPETGVDSIVLTYGLLGPVMAIARPIAAFVTACTAGWVEYVWNRKVDTVSVPEKAGCSCEEPQSGAVISESSWIVRIRHGIKYAFTDLLDDISVYLVIGLFLSTLITVLIPSQWLIAFADNHFLTMIVMLLVGLPMYVCASASTPVAAALLMKGISPGAVLVFLLAGPASNISTMAMIRSVMGGRSLATYLASIAIVSLGMGVLLDWIYPVAQNFVIGNHVDWVPGWLKLASALVLVPMLLWSVKGEVQRRFKK